jgi:hypothetical protein
MQEHAQSLIPTDENEPLIIFLGTITQTMHSML